MNGNNSAQFAFSAGAVAGGNGSLKTKLSQLEVTARSTATAVAECLADPWLCFICVGNDSHG